ncbi:MAG: uracil-DNA glycosylase [Mariprofundaceae bacterium]|nr:uracil-DNA glycosylase [Mariprofundaceae bacterium]
MTTIQCRQCPRLSSFLDEVKAEHPDYFCQPVPAFGDPKPKLLIIGLAPGKHGANRSGRPFTGDYAGIVLYKSLHALGAASAPESLAVDDGLILKGVRITNAVKCLPPQNKVTADEIKTCNHFLQAELDDLPADCRLLVLGRVAHQGLMRAWGLKQNTYPFGHGAQHQLPNGRILFCSYHCSRYNIQTRRLSEAMLQQVLSQALA